MAQVAKIIDVTRSYVPVDPRTFPQTMHGTTAEDQPETRIPVIPYAGFNFLPTAYGYKSFFGLNSQLDFDAITSRVDEIFVIQTDQLKNIMIALAEDGIWTKGGDVSGAWVHAITLDIPAVGSHKDWTYCVIANTIYFYRQGEASLWRMNASNLWVPTAFVPNTLNMAGQIGIFKAGARLGFWDSDNSIAWSSFDDYADFVPAVATMAGAAKFNGVTGKIVTIKSEGDGFIIYATKSIVRVVRNLQSTYLWDTVVLLESAGIAYPFEVAVGPNDSLHFALTSIGLLQIENGRTESLIPSVIDYLKKSRDPIGIRFIQGRYLFFEVLNTDLIFGDVDFSRVTIPEATMTIQQAVSIIESYELVSGGATSVADMASILAALQQHHDSIQVWRSRGGCFIGIGYCLDTDYPIFEDHIDATILPATLTAFEADPLNFFAFNASPGNNTVTGPDGTTNVAVLPLPLTPTESQLGDASFDEANTQNFFLKQGSQWAREESFLLAWKTKLEEIEGITREAELPDDGTYTVGDITEEVYTFGPFLDLSFFGESNRVLGEYLIEETEDHKWSGVFMHRSIVRTFTVDITVTTETLAAGA